MCLDLYTYIIDILMCKGEQMLIYHRKIIRNALISIYLYLEFVEQMYKKQ